MAYTAEQTKFFQEFRHLSDAELTEQFNCAFGTDVGKAAIRKKRQRMGLIKSAEAIRIEWVTLMGLSHEETNCLLKEDPPVDIYWEQQRLSEAIRLAGRLR